MKARSMVFVMCLGLALAPALFAQDPTGPEIYKGKCAMCHGPSGQADTPMAKRLAVRNLSSPDVQKQSDSALAQTIAKGKGKMPPFGAKLDQSDIKLVVGHIRSFAGK
jgi:mono/diheme cytochrome c family protein